MTYGDDEEPVTFIEAPKLIADLSARIASLEAQLAERDRTAKKELDEMAAIAGRAREDAMCAESALAAARERIKILEDCVTRLGGTSL